MPLWKATPLPNREDELFAAIITDESERQLIAQVTSFQIAEDIVFSENSWTCAVCGQPALRSSASRCAELEARVKAQAAQLEQAQSDGAEWMRKNVMDILREKSIEFFKEYERRHGDTSSSDLIASNCVSAMRDIISYLPTWLSAHAPAPEEERTA